MSLNWQSPAYIERPRLLEALPNEVGYVIWLQAPAGFGKSVLAGQLASRLGWPTYWASSLLGDPKDQLARALGLPNQVPWAAITKALAEKPCLVVLEDLNGDEKLSPLLRASPALLLLASRGNLPYPELPKLRAEGRLLHLGAAELAFTREEARTLFAGREDWESAYLACGGWPLPLFLAYFTREQPDAPSLLRGLRDSLSSAAFREALLMSALPYLPLKLARAETFELFEKGLLRRIPQGFQLHSLMKDIALQRLKSELQVVVLAEQGRLPDELRAEALWHAELREHLIELLEEPRDLAILPEKLVAWRDFLRQGGPRTQLRLGEALLQTGRLEGFDLLRPLANHHEKTLAVIAMGHLIYFAVEPMLKTDGAEQEAQAYLERGRALLGQVKKELAGRFLNDAARFYFERGQPRDAEKMLHEALSYLPPESPYRVAALNNLSLLRFELEVAFALWPELSEEAARNNLGVWLNRLRRELEPWGVPTYIGDGGLVRVESDLAQLEEALAAEQAERVLELYREPLLPGIYLEPVEERRRGLRWTVQQLFAKQDEPRYLKRLLELDPLDQEALERLIELFLRKGQKVIARNYLRHHLRRMEEELGEPPPLGLRRLMKMLE